ncbi:MAG: hypothetical protein ACPGWR_07180 [Ardenticatenaceae bacterium]
MGSGCSRNSCHDTLLVVSYQLSVISYQLSVISYQLSDTRFSESKSAGLFLPRSTTTNGFDVKKTGFMLRHACVARS